MPHANHLARISKYSTVSAARDCEGSGQPITFEPGDFDCCHGRRADERKVLLCGKPANKDLPALCDTKTACCAWHSA
jgi:hypothetical protein